MYDYNLETQRVRVGENEYEVMNDLKFYGEYTGQIPYLRRNTKISVYKWLKKEYPSEYLLINNKGWFEPYKRDVEDGVELVIPDVVKNAMSTPKAVEPKVEDNKSAEIFQDAINKLADKIGDMGTKIEAMNTNTKLEEALIQGIVAKGKDLATEELEKELKDRLDGFIKETYGALPQKLTIVHKDIEYDKTGIFHKMFDKVLKLVDMNLPVMLTGGAGAYVRASCKCFRFRFLLHINNNTRI